MTLYWRMIKGSGEIEIVMKVRAELFGNYLFTLCITFIYNFRFGRHFKGSVRVALITHGIGLIYNIQVQVQYI